MQGDDPRGICSRNQNNDRQSDTGISISGLLQPEAKRKQADEKNREHEGGKICSEIICLDCSDRRAQGCRDYAFDGERERGAETGLHHDQSRDCRPISFGHLHQARDDDGRGRRQGRPNGVPDGRKILFLPAPEFHARMILPPNPFWQDRLQEILSDNGPSRYLGQFGQRRSVRVF